MTILLLECELVLFAQKPALDTAALSNWPYIQQESISPDGNYVCYSIVAGDRPPVLYVQSTDEPFRLEIAGGGQATFTADSKRLICQVAGDSLCVIDLKARRAVFTPGVASYQLPKAGNGRWLGYRLTVGELAVADLYSGKQENYGAVRDYLFSNTGKALVIERSGNLDGKAVQLEWVDLGGGQKKVVYRGTGLSHLTFSDQENRLAFFAEGVGGERTRQVLYWYRAGGDSARVMVDEGTMGLEAGYAVEAEELEFSPDGKKVFFWLRRIRPVYPPTRIGASVDIWNYQDRFLQYFQLGDRQRDTLESFRAVYQVRADRVLRLEEETDGFGGMAELNRAGNDNYLLTATKYNSGEGYFKGVKRSDMYLINTDDGSRQIIGRGIFFPPFTQYSQEGRYVLWYDQIKRAYFAYDISEKVCRNISFRIPFPVVDERDGYSVPPTAFGCGMWLPGDSAVLLYDQYDIWKVDPRGRRLPINLTAGYGRKHRVALRCSYSQQDSGGNEVLVDDKGGIILCALDEKNKSNGFYRINWHHGGIPELLQMDDALYYFSGSLSYSSFPNGLWKARDAERYLLRKQSSTEYPNLFITADFQSFKPITSLQPQQEFNWMRSGLVRWTTFSGHRGEGILYRPEDFNPKKKYPVIFNYYERLSEGLNNYLYPTYCRGRMNIPWFVSRGYLVFCPDIYYTPGDPGAGIYDYVVSAAHMMAAKPWVDRNRMGIQGHSFAGFETNYLITRTRLFAAAASSAGVSDMVSQSGEADLASCAGQFFVEYGQYRMAVPYWENMEAYLRNSAVFQVKKIATPLLILHNRQDGAVPWEQGVELFTALRRMSKPVWLLQYDDEGHNLGGKSAVDYTLRLTQYFDHYLKGQPEPRWMSVGVSARWKGIDDGLDLSGGKKSVGK
ncbi:MAG TPA: prolyl oligopeptidase family serine peptidase [Puia sp.]|uniref:alpha/beta hydrolase family protein n=1 Tax=Puia sp. TaxID=2045100 RepID=UPI002C5CB2A8|nr:prolyl oligopeptidase family serine peptidase [Puia sp.]HVU95505.1 prolyl oligopeptidase family serine peptidase [Puia sp.]